MSEELRKKFNIPDDHKIVQVETTWKQKRGQDTDTYQYDQIDPTGNVVARYLETDSTSIYPPFQRHVSFEKIQ
jgi:hypothetical protein